MKIKGIDEQIRELEKLQYKNWQRISFNLRKHLDSWSHLNVKPSWGNMKLSYWPVICNIGIDGSTAAELSRKSLITKQNISRTVKELEASGMISSKVNRNDKRSEVLMLTDEGKQLILETNTEVLRMNDIYRDLVGEKDLETTINVLNKILDYHEHLSRSANQGDSEE